MPTMDHGDKTFVESDLKVVDAPSLSEDEHRRASIAKITKVSSILTVLVSGLALFSDGMFEPLYRMVITSRN